MHLLARYVEHVLAQDPEHVLDALRRRDQAKHSGRRVVGREASPRLDRVGDDSVVNQPQPGHVRGAGERRLRRRRIATVPM